MKTRYTGGNWEAAVIDGQMQIFSGNRRIAGDLYDEEHEIPAREVDANARVMAAAPDLDLACSYALGVLESIPKQYVEKIEDILDEPIDLSILRSALAKARKGGPMRRSNPGANWHKGRAQVYERYSAGFAEPAKSRYGEIAEEHRLSESTSRLLGMPNPPKRKAKKKGQTGYFGAVLNIAALACIFYLVKRSKEVI